MYKVDVEKILREHSNNVYDAQVRYPNPFTGTEFKVDDFESDEFRMYSFKIKRCPLNRAHDWTICPYAHIGERARRRDPLRVPYVAVSCKNYRITGGACPRGELCEYAHGVFEYWLHPAKYRTQICNTGANCTRRVCFFAHKLDELRIEPTIRIPMWVPVPDHEQFEARARMLSTTNVAIDAGTTSNNIGCGPGLDVIEHHLMPNAPNPSRMSHPSSSRVVGSAPICERTQELRLEFLENLRMMRISDYNNYQIVQNNKGNNINEEIDVPNIDWVQDLLIG
ncbi:hypothetical protein RND81_05G070400 [Saponaria officinalis]|uniref:C3H1-type domain-containing protein n=1 Tax=Saponaria officinalis TaxID=3572 RepID=A0AAW1KYN7_SAPOF